MQTNDFDYHLPKELIAQQPSAERAGSRLMLVDRVTGAIGHYHASDLPALLKPGDLVVLNNTRVIPARVFGRKQKTGGKVEVLFIAKREHKDLKKVGRGVSAEPSEGAAHPEGSPYLMEKVKVASRFLLDNTGFWEAFLHSSGRPRPGDLLDLANGKIRARVKSAGEYGRVMLEISCAGDFSTILEEEGLPPLPPYIKRPKGELTTDDERRLRNCDYDRYQTVYAKVPGAIAAPTAGLHFTQDLLARLRANGIQFAEITLHVGPGTFIPVKSERVEDHQMEAEQYVIEEPAAAAINATLAEKRRVVAVGTTVVRALESAAKANGLVTAKSGWTDIFIYPPYEFKVVKALLTNFHLPRSTLLMLVSAFAGPPAGIGWAEGTAGRQGCAQRGRLAGRELIRRAYATAVREKYRFYSYGDCMMIV